jgi:hypothetical protein
MNASYAATEASRKTWDRPRRVELLQIVVTVLDCHVQ